MSINLLPSLFAGTKLINPALTKLRQHTKIRDAETPDVNISSVKNGDVIKVDRGAYDHYGIFVDKGKHVIHYTGADNYSDFNGTVRETTLSDFLCHSKVFFICRFPISPEDLLNTNLNPYSTSSLLQIWEKIKKLSLKNYHLYSGDETVERAKSKIGEKGYNIFFNNCEHFAVWCKTGIKSSSQVNKIIDTFLRTLNSKVQK